MLSIKNNFLLVLNDRQGMGQNMRFFYFSGDCETSKEQIKQNFLVVLDNFLRYDGGCADPANARICEANKVQVACGKTQSVGGKFKRSVVSFMQINILPLVLVAFSS